MGLLALPAFVQEVALMAHEKKSMATPHVRL
jgi:hypothetical protein